MKTCGFVILVIAASLVGCSDNETTIQPMATGTAGMPAAGSGGAGTTAGAAGGASTTTSPAAGSGGGVAGSSGGAGATAGTTAAGGAGAGGSGGSTVTAGAAGSDMPPDGGSAGTDALPPIPADKALPLVFVHGFAGSAQQYMSQAQRFIANGYPPERIRAYEHDGQGFDTNAFVTGLTQVVDGLLSEFNVSKVYLVGHSRGTAVSSTFLGNATQAAKVAKYVAVDGSPCPSGVSCITPNQAMFQGQKHVEVCTSKESFAMQYEFLIGEKPMVVDIVRQRAPVEISGRVVNFPANTGRAGTTLKLFEVDSQTGARTQTDPLATFMVGDNGNWGPTTVNPDKHYEFELTSNRGLTSHFYWQRFLRSSNLVRLLSGPPDSAARMNTNTSDNHTAMVVSRQREWLASDVLEISTKSAGMDQPVVNAITAAAGAANSIGIHIHDAAASPGNSSLAALPYFSSQSFQYGVDVFMPAADPPTGVITLRNLPRGDMSKPQVLNLPNWKSSAHFVSVVFSDSPQD